MSSPREVDLAIIGGTLVTPSGARRAGVAVDAGRVVTVGADDLLPPARRVVDATGLHLLPGLVDPEAHPGCYVPLKDDLRTESRAAAAAGVTTWGIHAPSTRMGDPDFVEFVQPEDVVSFHEPFGHFVDLVETDSAIDIYLTYMLETDQQAAEIPEYARDHGVTSYKLYLQSMSPEAEPHWPGRRAGLGHGFDDGTCYLAMENVAALGPPGVVCMHCENWEIARLFDKRLQGRRPRRLGRLVGPLAALPRGPPRAGLRLPGRDHRLRRSTSSTPRRPRPIARSPSCGPAASPATPRPARTGCTSARARRTPGASTCHCDRARTTRTSGRPSATGWSASSEATMWSRGRPATTHRASRRASGA